MAKAESEPLMSPGELKPLLVLAKRQPVNCAIGLSKDKMGLILLDKKAKPRKMLALLKKKAKAAGIEVDMASCRFGVAEVDKDEDSRLVQFVVNKEAPGAMRVKLLEQIKKAGMGKVEIRVDEALENEPEDDGDDTAEDAAPADPTAAATPEPAAAAAPEAAATPATPGAQASAGAAPAPASDAAPDPAGASPAGAGGDADAVKARLTGLVKRMMGIMGSNPAGADAMRTAAMAGQAALKGGDAAGAASAADTLERLLDAAPPAGAAAGPGSRNGPGSPVFGKARATWIATRKRVEDELEKLHDQLQQTYKGHGVVADLEKVFRSKVEPMMGALDHSLSDKLDEIGKTTDPAAHAKLVGEAKAIIAKYESYLSSEPLIAKLDDNPFVPLSIEKTLSASLTALSKAVT